MIFAAGIAPAFSFAQTAPLPNVSNTPACMDFKTNLRMGVTGDGAKLALLNVQLALSQEGFNIASGELGTFGQGTRAAVKAFQEKYKDDVLAPFGLTSGSGYVGPVTRMKLQALYGCRASQFPSGVIPASVSLAMTNLNLDSGGVSATICNFGKSDLPVAPFRIRLNGINRDFDAIGSHKAGGCTSDSWKYETWGLTYDPGAIFTAVSLIDPNGTYKTSKLTYPTSQSETFTVPVLPGAHLAVRSVLLKTTGVQGTFCNLGTVDLTSYPVRVTVNGTSKDFDVPSIYGAGKCAPMTWTYDNWGLTYKSGMSYAATVLVDPNNAYKELNEFDNAATVVGTP